MGTKVKQTASLAPTCLNTSVKRAFRALKLTAEGTRLRANVGSCSEPAATRAAVEVRGVRIELNNERTNERRGERI